MPRAKPGAYQRYWRNNLSRIVRLIRQVYEDGNSAAISVDDLRTVGQRRSENWRGHVTLSSKEIIDFARYYVLYLGEALLDSGALQEFGDTVFRLTVTKDLMLRVDKLTG
jgi:hypothetical protein